MATVLRRHQEAERAFLKLAIPMISVAIAGLGVATVIMADAADGLMPWIAGVFFVFLGAFLWFGLRSLLEWQARLERHDRQDGSDSE